MSDAALVYAFSGCRLDPAERTLRRDGEPISLTPKVFDLLLFLIRNRDRAVTKEELFEAIWPGVFIDPNNLNQNVFMLRRALGDSEGKVIETVPRVGYRFAAEVQEIPKQPVSAEARPPLLRVMIAAAAVLALILIITSFAGHRSVSTLHEVRSIAVLPFRTPSQGTEDDYLGFGLADALITRLSYSRQIAVRPSSSVRKFIKEPVDAIAAGRQLRVDAVLEGTLRRAGNRVRLSAQLVSIDTGEVLWATQIDRDAADLFTLEDSISEALVHTLALKLAQREKGPAMSAEAYDAYLRGRYHLAQRTPQDLKLALSEFEAAISRNPSYALANSALAETLVILPGQSILPSPEAYRRALEAAQRAIQLDGRLAEPHLVIAWIRQFYDRKWKLAESEYRKALELNPNLPLAHHWYSNYLMVMGRSDAAIREIDKARELDPRSLMINTVLGAHLLYARRYDDTVEQMQQTLSIDPNFAMAHFVLGLAYEKKAMLPQALAEMQRGLDLTQKSPYGMMYVAHAEALSGDRVHARELLDTLEERYASVQPVGIAKVYAALGDRDHALQWLGKAEQARANDLVWLRVDPMFDPIRDDPRFTAYCAKLGLP